MNPFRDYPKPVAHIGRRCFPFRRCEVCSRSAPQLLREFYTVVQDNWNTAELEMLAKAARSALL